MAETSQTRRLSEIREAFLSAGAPAEYSLGFERNSGGKKGIFMMAVLERRIRPWLCDGLCSKCVVLAFWPVGDVLLGLINGQCFLLGSETTVSDYW